MSATEFTLKFPIERDGSSIKVLTGRRAKVRDMQKFFAGLDKDPLKAMQEALADLFQVPIHVINDLDIEDYAPMQEWFQAFLEPMKSVSED